MQTYQIIYLFFFFMTKCESNWEQADLYTFRRNINVEHMHVFKASLNNVDWSDVMSNDDSKEACSIFHERFKEL